MEGKEKDYPMFDDLFEAADLGDLAEEQYISYSQSRLKLEDDREALEYEIAQERIIAAAEGRAEGRAEGLMEAAARLRANGIDEATIKAWLGI